MSSRSFLGRAYRPYGRAPRWMAANVSFDMLDDAKRVNWSHAQWYRSARMQQSCPLGPFGAQPAARFAQTCRMRPTAWAPRWDGQARTRHNPSQTPSPLSAWRKGASRRWREAARMWKTCPPTPSYWVTTGTLLQNVPNVQNMRSRQTWRVRRGRRTLALLGSLGTSPQQVRVRVGHRRARKARTDDGTGDPATGKQRCHQPARHDRDGCQCQF